MAAKRVSSKSEESFPISFTAKIDNWSAPRIDLKLDIRSADLSFSYDSKFFEFFYFFQGEYLLYHGQTTVAAEGEQIFRARDGYSHDFLPGHLNNIKKQIKKVYKSNQNKTMIDKWEVIDMKFVPHGKILDEDLKLLKSKINELEKKLPEKFEIKMKETVLLMFLASPTEKKKMVLCRYKSIDFEKELRHHPWRPKPHAHKKQKRRSSSILYYTKKNSSILYYNN